MSRLRFGGLEPELLAVSAEYLGTRWSDTHSTMVGCWPREDEEGYYGDASTPRAVLEQRWADEREVRVVQVWEAADWYGPAALGWADLAREAEVNPDDVLGDDWEQVVARVATKIEPEQDEPVRGTRDYAFEQAEEYRACAGGGAMICDKCGRPVHPYGWVHCRNDGEYASSVVPNYVDMWTEHDFSCDCDACENGYDDMPLDGRGLDVLCDGDSREDNPQGGWADDQVSLDPDDASETWDRIYGPWDDDPMTARDFYNEHPGDGGEL